MGSKVLQEVQHHIVVSNLDHLACHFPMETAATCASGKKVESANLTQTPMCTPENCVLSRNNNNNRCLDSGVLLNDNLPLLPPCRICGEKASGFHYGANTCEACKVFCCIISVNLHSITYSASITGVSCARDPEIKLIWSEADIWIIFH